MTAVSTDAAPASLRSVELSVEGMTCAACATRIERRLNSLDQVHARVSFASERATVEMSRAISSQELIDQIEDVGYSAHVAADDSPEAARLEMDAQVRSLGRRLAVAALLFMPLCDLSIALSLETNLRFAHWQWLLVALAAPVVLWAAWPFHRAAFRAARHGTFTMDTLVSLGIISATAWSLYSMFVSDATRSERSPLFLLIHRSGGAIYLDVAAGVTTFLLAGRYFEARSRRRTGDALRSLAALAAKDVVILHADGTEVRIPAARLADGQRFVVRPGETVAADGVVLEGRAALDRSSMTGESVPNEVNAGDRVLGGTIAIDGRLVVRATAVGAETQLSHMVRLVEHAQSEKADVQRLADRICAVFVPVVLLVAALTLTGWLLAGSSGEWAFSCALAVLIIACPCALGLATPTAMMVASGRGAQLGIFVKGYQALETSRVIDTVVFDKTGTVTTAELRVTDVLVLSGSTTESLLRCAGAVEAASEHAIARSIARYAVEQAGPLPTADDFRALAGLGACGVVDGETVVVGRATLLNDQGIEIPETARTRSAEWEADGRTVVFVTRHGRVSGALALADSIKASAQEAVGELRRLGLRCILLTGDNDLAARAVADAVGFDEVHAEMLPDQKVAFVEDLRANGSAVAMVGDGVNDGPALAAADLALAIGSGTDVAINAADMILLREDLRVVPDAIALARRTVGTIRGNLTWAFGYNVAAIPLAALGFLNPLIAGAAMALSSGFVVWNSARLRHFHGAPLPSPPAPLPVRTAAQERSPQPEGARI